MNKFCHEYYEMNKIIYNIIYLNHTIYDNIIDDKLVVYGNVNIFYIII